MDRGQQELFPKLYGEWTVWHSTMPRFSKSNAATVALYPQSRMELCIRRQQGPLLWQDTLDGNYHVIGSTECWGGGDGETHDGSRSCQSQLMLHITRSQRELLSIFGIGVDIPFMRRTITHRSFRLALELQILEQDDLFLSNAMYSIHLVRSIHSNQPDVNVPLSTLMASQLVGMAFAELLKILAHTLWFHDHI